MMSFIHDFNRAFKPTLTFHFMTKHLSEIFKLSFLLVYDLNWRKEQWSLALKAPENLDRCCPLQTIREATGKLFPGSYTSISSNFLTN